MCPVPKPHFNFFSLWTQWSLQFEHVSLPLSLVTTHSPSPLCTLSHGALAGNSKIFNIEINPSFFFPISVLWATGSVWNGLLVDIGYLSFYWPQCEQAPSQEAPAALKTWIPQTKAACQIQLFLSPHNVPSCFLLTLTVLGHAPWNPSTSSILIPNLFLIVSLLINMTPWE